MGSSQSAIKGNPENAKKLQRASGTIADAMKQAGFGGNVNEFVSSVLSGIIRGLTPEQMRESIPEETYKMMGEYSVRLGTYALIEMTNLLSAVVDMLADPENQDRLKKLMIALLKTAKRGKIGAYEALGDKLKIGGGPNGGCCCGGVDVENVGKYRGSHSEGVKESVIKSVLDFAAKEGAPISGSTNKEKLDSYYKFIKQSGANDPKRCRAIAKHLNEVYGSEIIQDSDDAAEVCSRVYEILHSLLSGMHSEFLVVYADVRTVIANLAGLQKLVDESRKRLKVRAEKAANPTDRAAIESELTNMDVVQKEIKRQLSLLNGLLNTDLLKSTADVLTRQMKDGDMVSGLIEKLRLNASSKNQGVLGDSLRRTLVLAASMANRTNEALRALGVSLAEYKNANTLSKLKELLVTKAPAHGVVSEDSALRQKYIEMLLDNVESRDRIIEELEKRGGASRRGGNDSDDEGADDDDNDMPEYDSDGSSGDARSAGSRGSARGGVDVGSLLFDEVDKSGYPVTEIERRRRAQNRLKDLVMSVFSRGLVERFDKFVTTLNIFADAIGTKIPITDALNELSNVVARVEKGLVYQSEIYYALVGYFGDAKSQEQRDRFLGDLQMISNHLDSMLAMKEYQQSAQHLRDIKSAIQNIVEFIGKYTDEVAQKFGKATGAGDARSAPKRGGAGGPIAIHPGTSFSPSFVGACDDCGGDGKRGGAAYDDDDVVDDDNVDMEKMGGGSTITFSEPTSFSTNYGDLDTAGASGPLGHATSYASTGTPAYAQGAYENAEAMYGGVEHGGPYIGYANITGGAAYDDDNMNVYRMPRRITDALHLFDRRIRAAKILQNIGATAGETASYGKDQDDLNAQSIMVVVSRRKREQAWMTKQLDEMSDGDITNIGGGNKAEGEAQVKAARELLQKQYRALQGFWSAAEALDKRLRTFTTALTRDADKIKDFNSILRDVEVISEWQGEGSGNILASIFEHFPAAPVANLADATSSDATGATPAARARHALINVGTNDHYYVTVAVAANTPNVGVPQNVTTPKLGLDAAKKTHGFFLNSMRALKNLFSIFIHSDKTVGADVIAEQLMSPIEMYQKIMSFLVASAFSQGFNFGDGSNDEGKPKLWDNTDAPKTVTVQGRSVNVGLAARPAVGPAGPAAGVPRKQWYFMKHYGVFMRVIQHAGVQDFDGFSFRLEDEYFVSLMKSACASVMALTGTISLLHRPEGIASGFSPVRMILGGADETPEVVPEAVALYLRLPLLAQWYRELFGDAQKFEDRRNLQLADKNVKIAMVPDIDGTFAGLIRLVFRDLRSNDTTSYTDEDVRKIVREVNLIYQRQISKHPENLVRGTVSDFVNEVSRRYGIISKTSYEAHNQTMGREYDYTNVYKDSTDGDLAILPGETEDRPRRLTPSERLIGDSDEIYRERKSQFALTSDHQKIVNQFRCAIDGMLQGGDPMSFNEPIRSAQTELKSETRPDRRFDIVASLVRGADLQSRVDGMKYVMFNETVVAGLNALSVMHSMLYRFQQRAIMLDIQSLRNIVVDYFAAGVATGGPAAGAVPKDMNGLVQYVLNELVNRGVVLNHPRNKQLLERVFGKDQNSDLSGGDGAAAAAADYTLRRTDGMPDTAVNIDRIAAGTTWGGEKQKLNSTAGLIALLNGLSPERIRTLMNQSRCNNTTDINDRKNIDLFFRFLFDRQFVMKELLETVFGLGNDDCGLVKISLSSDSALQVTYGALTENIRSVFKSVFYFLQLLRPRVDEKLFQRYTNKTNLGSYYWLQEQLLEKIIVGRDERTGTAPKKEYPNLDKISHAISRTWAALTAKSSDGANIAGVNSTTSTVESRTSYFRTFSEMVFYNAEIKQSGLYGNESTAKNSNSHPQIAQFRSNPYDALLVSGPPEKKVLDSRFIARFQQLYTWDKEYTLNRSLLFGFNQLVAKFIQSFYDTNTGKIYLGLLDKFANGVFSQAVADFKHTYPDVVPTVQVKFTGATSTPVNSLDVFIAGNDARYNAILAALNQVLDTMTVQDRAGYLVPGGPGRAGTGPGRVQFFDDMDAQLGANPLNNLQAQTAAVQANLFASNMVGSGGDDEKSRREMLAAMLTRADTNAGATLVDGYRTLAKNTTMSVPVSGSFSKPKYQVPADDFASLDESDPERTAILSGANEKSVLVFARSGAIGGAGAGGIDGLGVPIGAPPAGTQLATTLTDQMEFGQRADPTGDTVLFTSLAMTLRTIMTSKTSSCPTCSAYITDNIAEVPLHMKEKMRANLPVFRRMLAEMVKRANFIKEVFSRSTVDLTRKQLSKAPAAGGPVQAIDLKNVWPFNLQGVENGSSANKNRLVGIIDTIVSGCNALIGACVQVLREVGDDPKYLEFSKDSIREYAQNNGTNPFMPLSSAMVSLKNLRKDTYKNFLPLHSLGETEFKMMYGTRGLLDPQAKVSMENTVGFADIVNTYNLMVPSSSAAEQSQAGAFLDTFVRALRYANCLRVKGFVSSHVTDTRQTNGDDVTATPVSAQTAGVFVREDLVVDDQGRNAGGNAAPRNAPGAGVAEDNHIYGQQPYNVKSNHLEVSLSAQQKITLDDVDQPNPVYALAKTLEETTRLTDSSNREEMIADFVTYLFQHNKKKVNLAIQNIIDMDIVPINVHALMREIPFATTLNYAYSFDRMVVELYYGAGGKNADKIITELCEGHCTDGDLIAIRSAKDALVAMLINPYLDFSADAGTGERRANAGMLEHVAGMMRGATGLDGLNRPKFLSDEVYGKSIFGELYCEPGSYNEMGPGAGHVVSVKIDRNAAIKIARDIINRQMTAARAGGLQLAAAAPGPIDDALAKLSFMVARYFIDNPRASIDDAFKILKKEGHLRAATATTPIAGSLNLAVAGGAGNVETVMIGMAIIGKIASVATRVLQRGADIGDYTVPTVVGDAPIVTARNVLGLYQDFVDQRSYLGLGADKAAADAAITNRIGAAATSGNYDGILNALRTSLLSSSATVESYAPTFNPAGAAGAAPAPARIVAAAAATDVNLRDILRERIANFNYGSTATLAGQHNPTKLHYLGDYNDEKDGTGATIQPDNANIVDSRQVKSVDVPAGAAAGLATAGALRFDTILCRNIVFIVNLVRTLRMHLQSELHRGDGRVVSANANVAQRLTEAFGNELSSRTRYHGKF